MGSNGLNMGATNVVRGGGKYTTINVDLSSIINSEKGEGFRPSARFC